MGAAEAHHADFLTDQICRPANTLLRNQAEWKFIQRRADEDQIGALIDGADQRGAVDLAKMSATADQRLSAARRAGDHDQIQVDVVLGEQAKILRRPERRLKAGKAGVAGDVALLGAKQRRRAEN